MVTIVSKLVQVIYGRRVKRITLQRVLVGKIVFFPKEVSFKDLILLYDNIIWCQDKSQKDPDFKTKFGLHLKVLASILKEVRLPKDKISERLVKSLGQKFQRNLDGFYLEKRNVKNPLKQLYKFIELRAPQPLGLEKKRLRPKNFIGVGYRDKGTAKKPWYDGSPSWQEVAIHNSREEL